MVLSFSFVDNKINGFPNVLYTQQNFIEICSFAPLAHEAHQNAACAQRKRKMQQGTSWAI